MVVTIAAPTPLVALREGRGAHDGMPIVDAVPADARPDDVVAPVDRRQTTASRSCSSAARSSWVQLLETMRTDLRAQADRALAEQERIVSSAIATLGVTEVSPSDVVSRMTSADHFEPPLAPCKSVVERILLHAEEGRDLDGTRRAACNDPISLKDVWMDDPDLDAVDEADLVQAAAAPPSGAGKDPQKSSYSFSREASGVSLPDAAGTPVLKVSGLNDELLRRATLGQRLSRLAASRFPGVCLMRPLANFFRWREALVEPPRAGRLARFVDSNQFSMLCATAIFLNAGFVMYRTDYEMKNLSDRPTMFMFGTEWFFVAFFSVELLLKLVVHRWYYFCISDAAWNVFDFLLVGFTLAESLFMTLERARGSQHDGINLGYLRSLRIFNLAKVLRIFRTLRLFSELRLMVDCVVGSMLSLFWCFLMLVFILYVFSLALMQGLAQTLREDPSLTPETRAQLNGWFGSVGRAMATLLQATTSGLDWGEVFSVFVQHSPWLTFVFLFYILFFAIAAWNIITSTFIEKAFKLTRPDHDSKIMEEKLADMIDAERLILIFNEIDTDNSKKLSSKEFAMLAGHPQFKGLMRCRGIDIHDVGLFYEMLVSAAPDEEVDIRTFVNACLRMKGPATSMDLHTLNFETKMLRNRQAKFEKEAVSSLRVMKASLFELLGAARERQPLVAAAAAQNRDLGTHMLL